MRLSILTFTLLFLSTHAFALTVVLRSQDVGGRRSACELKVEAKAAELITEQLGFESAANVYVRAHILNPTANGYKFVTPISVDLGDSKMAFVDYIITVQGNLKSCDIIEHSRKMKMY